MPCRERLREPFEQGDVSTDQQHVGHQSLSTPRQVHRVACEARAPRPPSLPSTSTVFVRDVRRPRHSPIPRARPAARRAAHQRFVRCPVHRRRLQPHFQGRAVLPEISLRAARGCTCTATRTIAPFTSTRNRSTRSSAQRGEQYSVDEIAEKLKREVCHDRCDVDHADRWDQAAKRAQHPLGRAVRPAQPRLAPRRGTTRRGRAPAARTSESRTSSAPRGRSSSPPPSDDAITAWRSSARIMSSAASTSIATMTYGHSAHSGVAVGDRPRAAPAARCRRAADRRARA